MIFFYMILTTLATTDLAKGAFECNVTASTGAQQCFGALGEPLIFYLAANTKEKKFLKKNNVTILKFAKNKTLHMNNEHSNGTEFFTTFELNKATKKDSGVYQLDSYDFTSGLFLRTINLNVEIQAPVSQPALSQMCLSPEKMKVSCSSEEDGVEFILTLDNNLLIRTRAGTVDTYHKPNSSIVTITLHGQLTGNLICHVQNNVSREEAVIHLASCEGSTLQPILWTLIAIIATLILLLVLLFGIKNFRKKTRHTTINEDNAEVVYSEVTVKHAKKSRHN